MQLIRDRMSQAESRDTSNDKIETIDSQLSEVHLEDHQQLIQNGSQNEEEDQETKKQQTFIEPLKCIVDPYQYLAYCLGNKKIKIMDEQNSIFPNVYLKDISLHYKGPMEDKAYSKNYSYYNNIRRGNTLCQIYNKQKTEGKNTFEIFFCRRGMKKFYDLEKEYLATGFEDKLTSQHLKYRRRIFEKIDSVDYQHSRIHLYSIFKENGEHCQVTYVKKISAWLFASKNVSIIVRNQDDIEKHYQKIRFYWAKLIAKQFLTMLKHLNSQQVEQLKSQLDTKTLLGEHCGYEQHQHITKYDQVQIIFYGIVQKTGEDHCMPVDYCTDFLKKYNFKMSRTKEIRNIKDKNTCYQSIYTLLKQTAQGTMEQYGEGSVLYVVEEKNKVQRTIAMCKLKTCEYLIFRRLRQMLKLSVERKSTANTYEKFKFDIENLVAHYFKPPKSVEFYLKVGKQAFKQAGKDTNVTETYLRYKFVQFMQRVEANSKSENQGQNKKGELRKKVLVVSLPRFTNKLQKYAKSISIPMDYMYRNLPSNLKKQQKQAGSLHILHMIPRLPQEAEILQNLQIFVYEYDKKAIEQIEDKLTISKDLTKSHLITFIKSEDKRRSLQLLSQKIQLFTETLQKKGIKFTLISKEVQDKDELVINKLEELRFVKMSSQEQDLKSQEFISTNKQQSSHRLFMIYPMLLPGSGKSTLRQQLEKICQQNKFTFSKIDGDQIRNKYMQINLKQKGVQMNLETQQFSQTFGQVKQQVNQQYKSILTQNIQNHLKQSLQDQILFVDKVFGPQNIQNQLEFLAQYQNVVPIILIPQSTQLKLKCFTLPFSLEYLLICLKRCIQRFQHSTMTREPVDVCAIFLWYLKLYSNCSFKKTQTVLQKVNPHLQFCKVQTVQEKQGSTHCTLKKKLQQCIESSRNQDRMISLIEEMYKNSHDYLKDTYLQNSKQEAAHKLFQTLKKISQSQ